MIFFAFSHHYLIFTGFGNDEALAHELIHRVVAKKKVTLYTVNDNQWHEEAVEILWPYEGAGQVHSLVSVWLATTFDDATMVHRVAVQNVLMSPSTLYISLDRYPFDETVSLFDKLMWVEGLLKTIRENGIKSSELQLLVNNQSLVDPHLDCSRPWPLIGFLCE